MTRDTPREAAGPAEGAAPRRRPGRGMTLIEVMVAVTILALVSTVVFGGFSQTMTNKRFVEADADRSHVIRVAMERMVRELASAYVSLHRNPNPALRTMNTTFIGGRAGRGHRLDFTTFAHRRLYRDAHESDQAEISYFLARHPEERDTWVLARREQRRVDEDPQRGGSVQILVEDVRGFDLEFYDPLANDWVERWDATPDGGREASRLPSQVKIRLTVGDLWDPEEEEVYTTRAQPMITWAVNHSVYQ